MLLVALFLASTALAEPLSCELVRDLVDAGVSDEDVVALARSEGVVASELHCVESTIPLTPAPAVFTPYDSPYMLRENPYEGESCASVFVPSPMTAALASATFGFGAGHYYAGSRDSAVLLSIVTAGAIIIPLIMVNHPNVSADVAARTPRRAYVFNVALRLTDTMTAAMVAQAERDQVLRSCPGILTR